jgi:hypothetical protein
MKQPIDSSFYTFVMEFEGGTYISQAYGDSLKSAMMAWAETLDTKQIKGMGPVMQKEIVIGIEDEDPTALTGLKNAWCFSLIARGKFCLVHFFETVG